MGQDFGPPGWATNYQNWIYWAHQQKGPNRSWWCLTETVLPKVGKMPTLRMRQARLNNRPWYDHEGYPMIRTIAIIAKGSPHVLEPVEDRFRNDREACITTPWSRAGWRLTPQWSWNMYHNPTIRVVDKCSGPNTWSNEKPDHFQHSIYKYLTTTQVWIRLL